MADEEATIEELKKAVARFRDERDWRKYHNPKDLAVSISIEAGELLEIFQWKGEKEVETTLRNWKELRRIKSELADVMIYCIALAEILDIDISEAILEKIQENSRKYPVEKVRGNYRKYTELK